MISTSKAGSHFVSLHRATTAPAVLCRQLISASCGIGCAAGFLRCALYRSISARLPSRALHALRSPAPQATESSKVFLTILRHSSPEAQILRDCSYQALRVNDSAGAG